MFRAREPPRVSAYKFVSNERPTLGVEIELNLVDAQTMALRSGVLPILGDLPEALAGSVKPELFQCYLEINTAVCRDVREVEADLNEKLQLVRQIAPPRHVSLLEWNAPIFALAESGREPRRALSRADRTAPGDGPPDRDVRPACPRRGRLRRQGDHDLRPDHAPFADLARVVGQ